MPFSQTARLVSSFCLAGTLLLSPVVAFAAPAVVTTIKPLHSLVAGVMAGAGTPQLLIEGGASPHGYSLKPSQASMLQDADVVFWIGENLETSLKRPIATMAEKALRVELADAPGITLLDLRVGDGFEKHDHHHDDEHEDEHEDHAPHDADHHDDDHHEVSHEEDDHHHEGGKDMHLWLDPENARTMVQKIAVTLSEADPENAALYQANAKTVDERLVDLSKTVDERLAPAKGKPFIVFHDAYHYFENRFGITAAGAIALNPEIPAGASRIADIHALIHERNAVCIFAEPQFEPKLISVVVEGSGAKTGVLDPLGSSLEDGSELYFQLITNLADAMSDCLSDS